MITSGHKLILFDIDGTLVLYRDRMPERIFEDMTQYFFDKEVSLADYRFSGKTDKAIIRDTLALAGIEGVEHETNELAIMEWVADELDRRSYPDLFHLLPNVEVLLEELSSRKDTTLALLTGNLPRCAETKLAQFDLNKYFSFGAFGVESVNRNDLGPVALQRFAHHHGFDVSGEDVVIIGDAIPDVLCAQHIGAKSVITLTGRTTREELEPYSPDFIFNDLSDTNVVLNAIYQ
jgi:phosphoglycolate phosphatase